LPYVIYLFIYTVIKTWFVKGKRETSPDAVSEGVDEVKPITEKEVPAQADSVKITVDQVDTNTQMVSFRRL